MSLKVDSLNLITIKSELDKNPLKFGKCGGIKVSIQGKEYSRNEIVMMIKQHLKTNNSDLEIAQALIAKMIELDTGDESKKLIKESLKDNPFKKLVLLIHQKFGNLLFHLQQGTSRSKILQELRQHISSKLEEKPADPFTNDDKNETINNEPQAEKDEANKKELEAQAKQNELDAQAKKDKDAQAKQNELDAQAKKDKDAQAKQNELDTQAKKDKEAQAKQKEFQAKKDKDAEEKKKRESATTKTDKTEPPKPEPRKLDLKFFNNAYRLVFQDPAVPTPSVSAPKEENQKAVQTEAGIIKIFPKGDYNNVKVANAIEILAEIFKYLMKHYPYPEKGDVKYALSYRIASMEKDTETELFRQIRENKLDLAKFNIAYEDGIKNLKMQLKKAEPFKTTASGTTPSPKEGETKVDETKKKETTEPKSEPEPKKTLLTIPRHSKPKGRKPPNDHKAPKPVKVETPKTDPSTTTSPITTNPPQETEKLSQDSLRKFNTAYRKAIFDTDVPLQDPQIKPIAPASVEGVKKIFGDKIPTQEELRKAEQALSNFSGYIRKTQNSRGVSVFLIATEVKNELFKQIREGRVNIDTFSYDNKGQDFILTLKNRPEPTPLKKPIRPIKKPTTTPSSKTTSTVSSSTPPPSTPTTTAKPTTPSTSTPASTPITPPSLPPLSTVPLTTKEVNLRYKTAINDTSISVNDYKKGTDKIINKILEASNAVDNDENRKKIYDNLASLVQKFPVKNKYQKDRTIPLADVDEATKNQLFKNLLLDEKDQVLLEWTETKKGPLPKLKAS